MKQISRSALLPYSAQQMFDLVNDVARYPEFLPWCGGSAVSLQTAESMQASVTIAKAGISKTFTTQNTWVSGERIEMALVDGPFKSLFAVWTFQVLDECACKILFNIDFEMNSGVLNAAIGAIFEQIASTLVDSFCQRAKACYE